MPDFSVAEKCAVRCRALAEQLWRGQQSLMKPKLDNTLWRIINACAAVLVLVCGFCSHETYERLREAAHVTRLTPAVVNHNMFWSMGLATLLAVYVYRQSVDRTREIGWAGDRALTVWMIAAIAFLPLPLAMAFRWHVPGARSLYLGYTLKAACFLYLYWLFFRYHVLDDHDAFADGWTLFHGRKPAARTANPTSATTPTHRPPSDGQRAGPAVDSDESSSSGTTSSEL